MIYRKCEITEPYPNEFLWIDPDNIDVQYCTDRAAPLISGGHGNCKSLADCQEEIDEYREQSNE